jgi:hypothetical protein
MIIVVFWENIGRMKKTNVIAPCSLFSSGPRYAEQEQTSGGSDSALNYS